MAVFRRRGRRNFDVEPNVPGLGLLGRFSAGRADERTARAMEQACHELAVTGWPDLLEQLRAHEITLPELYIAKLGGPARLEELRRRRTDPPLADVVADFRPKVADERIRTGLDQLLALAPASARLSYLLDPPNVTDLYARAVADGRRPNSVRRSLHRAVADLLKARFGRGRMLQVMADVAVPAEQDERQQSLSAKEIEKLIAACDEEFRLLVQVALLTGIDRGPQLALRVRDFDDEAGTLRVPDTKTPFRGRELELGDEARRVLRLACAGRDAHDRIFPFTADQVRSRWEAARDAIGRKDVRWKDLRGIFATAYLRDGGDPRQLQHVLGHSTMAMTLRYLRRLPVRGGLQMDRAAKALGMKRSHLRVEKGGA